MNLMSTHTKEVGFTPAETTADLQAVLNALYSDKPLDPEVARRVDERAEKVREELRLQGVTDVAVELLRESRNEI